MIQSNWVRSPSCKPQIHSHARVMRFMPCQRASLRYREQPLVGYDEGVPFPRWYSVSPIQSGEGGGRSAHVWRSFTGKTTTREPRSALQQLLRPRSREILDAQHLGSHQDKKKKNINSSELMWFIFSFKHIVCTVVPVTPLVLQVTQGRSACIPSLVHTAPLHTASWWGSTELKVCLFVWALGVLLNEWHERWLWLCMGTIWYNLSVPGN